MEKTTDKPASFEAALAELEQLVATMEGGQLPLEQSLAAYKRGAALLADGTGGKGRTEPSEGVPAACAAPIVTHSVDSATTQFRIDFFISWILVDRISARPIS